MYLGVSLSAATATGVLVSLRALGAAPVPELAIPDGPLRAVVIVLLVVAAVALRMVSATLPPVRGDLDGWWEASVGRAVAIWALAEGVAVAGAVAYLLSDDLLVLALAAGWAAAMFVRYTPRRLADG